MWFDNDTPGCVLSSLHAWLGKKEMETEGCGLLCFWIDFCCFILLEHLWKFKSTLAFISFLGVRNRHKCYSQWLSYVGWNPLTPSKTKPTFCWEKISPVLQRANISVDTEASNGIWELSIYCRWPSFTYCSTCTCWCFKTQELLVDNLFRVLLWLCIKSVAGWSPVVPCVL